MKSKLIMVEGLPGFGKTTTAKLIYDILTEKKVPAELFLEGNLDHPADYDGVACFTPGEFTRLLASSGEWEEVLAGKAEQKEDLYFLPYRKILNEIGRPFPDDLLGDIFQHEIYELPLSRHMGLVEEKWSRFAEKADAEDKTYIFECCFIQNPVTIAMVKYGEKEKVVEYVMRLAKIVEGLHPVLIYIGQDDLERSFRKAMNERPKEWLDGFVDYYTKQGYGKQHHYSGVEGTLKVLEAREAVEREIVYRLEMRKERVNNTSYETAGMKEMLNRALFD